MSKQWPHQHYRAGVLYSLSTVDDLEHPRGRTERHLGRHCVYSSTPRFPLEGDMSTEQKNYNVFQSRWFKKGCTTEHICLDSNSKSRMNKNFTQALSKSYRHLSLTLPGLPVFFPKEKVVAIDQDIFFYHIAGFQSWKYWGWGMVFSISAIYHFFIAEQKLFMLLAECLWVSWK